jgi:hypothetical protein
MGVEVTPIDRPRRYRGLEMTSILRAKSMLVVTITYSADALHERSGDLPKDEAAAPPANRSNTNVTTWKRPGNREAPQ